MKTDEFIRWDINLLECPYNEQLEQENELGSLFSEALENISPTKRLEKILSPVAKRLSSEISELMAPKKVRATSNNSFEEMKRQQLLAKINKRLSRQFDEPIRDIDRYLFVESAQTTATNEHNKLKNKRDFRHNTLIGLRQLAQLLPPNHPVRIRIESTRG